MFFSFSFARFFTGQFFLLFLSIQIDLANTSHYRALVIVQIQPHKMSHYDLHKRLAEILHSDTKNFEYVHFLVLTSNNMDEQFPVKLIHSQDKRMTTQIESFEEKKAESDASKKDKKWVAPTWKDPWQHRERFDPYPDSFKKWLGPLKNNELLKQLDAHKFNVGIVEVINASALAMFEMLPTIRWTVATSAVVPNLRLYENLAFFELKQLIPEVNHTEIGDHEIVGKDDQQLRELAKTESQFEAFEKRLKQMREKNVELLEIRAIQDDETWKLYKPIVEKYRQKHHHHNKYSFPTLRKMFQKISYFFVNTQLSQNMPLVQTILTNDKPDVHLSSAPSSASTTSTSQFSAIEDHKLREKIRFFGGIGLPEHLSLDDPHDENKILSKGILECNKKILDKIPMDMEIDDLSGETEIHHTGHQSGHRDHPKHINLCPKTILVAFGTAIGEMPKEIRHIIHQAFSEFAKDGIQFIWKARDAKSSSKGYTRAGNIFLSNWIPQAAILAHPKTALFISHCGANSMQEAAISNVPLICVPFKADQYYNAEGMASRGWATVLDIREPNMEIFKTKLIENIRWHLSMEKKPEMHMKNRAEMAKEFLDALVKIRDGDDEKH